MLDRVSESGRFFYGYGQSFFFSFISVILYIKLGLFLSFDTYFDNPHGTQSFTISRGHTGIYGL